jgi:hypothetical protein
MVHGIGIHNAAGHAVQADFSAYNYSKRECKIETCMTAAVYGLSVELRSSAASNGKGGETDI